MLKRPTATAVLAVIALLGAAVASAETTTWKFDPPHSEALFSIRHIFTKVQGRFNDMEGTIQLDDKDLSKSSVDVTIKTASIFTNNEKRDNHLRSGDFFDAEKNPTITFKSTKVIPGEDKKFKVEGDLTMRGVSKPVTLDVEYLGGGAWGMGGQVFGTKAGWVATTKVNRQDWGISWNKTLDQGGTLLGDDVDLTLNVEADKQAPAATQPAATKK
ncbi:MAG: YceI family protein [Candidatus Eisenbacteria bacterium]